MKKQITFTIDTDELPEHTNEEFKQWIEYLVGDGPLLSVNNSLIHQLPSAECKSIVIVERTKEF